MSDNSITSVSARLMPFAFTALRFATGAMFAFHGVQKIFGYHAGSTPEAGSQIWVGGVIELVCGTLIALGLFTRLAAFLASGTMAVAYTQFHWKLAVADAMWIPGVNKGELALVYALLFLVFALSGGGVYALDALRGRSAAAPIP